MTNRREITPARSPQKHAGARTKRGHGAKPEAVRERAVLALLHERTVAEAAKTAGVDESTVRRWLADDDAFKAHYAAARKTAFEAGMSRVQALTGKAIETLDDLLDATNHPNVRPRRRPDGGRNCHPSKRRVDHLGAARRAG